MKNALLTLIISLAAMSLKAVPFSNLNITMADNNRYEVVFNNQLFNNAGINFMFNNIAPGRYPIAVARILPAHGGFKRKVVYNGVIDIPAGSNVNAFVDHMSRFQVSYSPIIMPNQCAPTQYTPNQYGPGQCGNQGGHYEPVLLGMSPAAFAQLKSTIANQWFDSGKLMVAKQAIMSNPVTSAQVAELMALMSFENSKLELAKMAFVNTIDKQNYYIVNNEFWFSSSVADLNQYITRL